MFWYCWQRWPRAVLTEGGQVLYDELAGEARPGGEKPAFIALIHVVTTGLKQIQWYQIVRICLLSSVKI